MFLLFLLDNYLLTLVYKYIHFILVQHFDLPVLYPFSLNKAIYIQWVYW